MQGDSAASGGAVHRKLTLHEWSDATTVPAGATAGGAATAAAAGGAAGGAAAAASSSLQSRAGVAVAPSTVGVAPLRELYESAMACTERKAYLIGGYDPRSHCNVRQVVEWDLHTRLWSRQADMPEALSQAAAVALEDVCFVWGGWTGTAYSNRLWLLSAGDAARTMGGADALLSRTSLQPPQASSPSSAAAAAAAASSSAASPHRGAAGGRAAKEAAAASSGASSGADLYHWTLLPLPCHGSSGGAANGEACAPTARCGHSLVLGLAPAHLCPVGAATDKDDNAAAAATTAGSDHAAQAQPQQPSQASPHADDKDRARERGRGGDVSAEAVEPVAYLFGGFDGTRRRNDVWRLWLRASVVRRCAVWQRVHAHSGTAPSPRDAAAVAYDAMRNCLYVFGGYASTLMNDLHALELEDLCDRHHHSSKDDGGDDKDADGGAAHTTRKPRWVAVPYAMTSGSSNNNSNNNSSSSGSSAAAAPSVVLPPRRQGCIAAVNGNYLVVFLGSGEGGAPASSPQQQQAAPLLLQLSLTELRWSGVVAGEVAHDMLAGRNGYVGCAGDRSRRLLVYGGGDVTRYRASVVEVELDKLDGGTAGGSSGGSGGGGKKK